MVQQKKDNLFGWKVSFIGPINKIFIKIMKNGFIDVGGNNMVKRLGNATIEWENSPCVCGYAAVGSQYEKKGPLGPKFDRIFEDPLAGYDSWEKAESELQKSALGLALQKAGISTEMVSALFAGDLLNQCTGSTFGLKEFSIPFVGVYGACSTMALSLIMAAVFLGSGAGEYAAAVTSSHFCSAERQYRFPLEYGGQRPPTAQWTATASGAVVLGTENKRVKIRRATLGRVWDLGVADANNMGAAMAPQDVKIRPYPLVSVLGI